MSKFYLRLVRDPVDDRFWRHRRFYLPQFRADRIRLWRRLVLVVLVRRKGRS